MISSKFWALALRYSEASAAVRNSGSALVLTVSFFASKYVEAQVTAVVASPRASTLVGIATLVFITAVGSSTARWVRDEVVARAAKNRLLVKNMYERVAACDWNQAADSAPVIERSVDEYLRETYSSAARLKRLCSAVHEVLDTNFGNVESSNPIRFEVTVMARSFDDGELTIVSWANKQSTPPVSLAKRRENPKIYDTTYAGDILRQNKAMATIVSSTGDKSAKFQDIYSGQRDKIRSMCLIPIVSPRSEVIAVLVVHCDQDGFFSENELKFWNELLSVAARPIREVLLLQASARRSATASSSA